MFPKSTIIAEKFIAKDKFYSHGDFTTKLKKSMVDDVARIVVVNQFSQKTLNVEQGKVFPEIIVIKLLLKNKDFNKDILDIMDKSIRASYVLFMLEYDNSISFSIAFKDRNVDKISITKRWTSPFAIEYSLNIEGVSIDLIYESLIEQIATLSGNNFVKRRDKNLKEEVNITISNEKLERKIAQLENKMRNEKQFKKQIEIKAEIKQLKEELV